MEDFLNSLIKTKKCYEKYKFEDVLHKSNIDIKSLCIEQRIELISSLLSSKMTTSNLIKDRIALLEEREKERKVQRRKFLDRE